ncbi:hypothetical protein AVEN_8296-1 [Araneus ventricosus]|uniref:Uncharacterized protein n=1 Tax=Araneus ventricosus TaxID=182803 RepID=A0A4Y2UVK9_ARAVE|nr:hypothetical protein AVEN_8296-1 [Araneus ventricosus]
MTQALFPRHKDQRMKFYMDMQDKCEHENGFSPRLVFSDKATFHVSGKVNRHNVRMWGTENPPCSVEHERDSAKVNVFCAVSDKKLYGPFFIVEETVNGNRYLDMLQVLFFPAIIGRLE